MQKVFLIEYMRKEGTLISLVRPRAPHFLFPPHFRLIQEGVSGYREGMAKGSDIGRCHSVYTTGASRCHHIHNLKHYD